MVDPTPELGRGWLDLPRGVAATIVLVRHGESTWIAEGRFQGRKDPPLSELGVRQARLVAERLAQRDEHTPLPIPAGTPVAIWHSPLRRAADTARVIAQLQTRAGGGTSPALVASAGLTEIAQGDWEGQPMAEVRARWAHELAAWRRTPAEAHAPGGEPLVDAASRVHAAVVEVVTALGAAAPAAATATSDEAGDLASLRYDPVPGYPTAVRTAAGEAPDEPWGVLVAHDGIFRLALISLIGVSLERFWSFPFNLAAISVVALHEGVATLRAHNLSDHLEPLAAEDRAAQESRGERRGAL